MKCPQCEREFSLTLGLYFRAPWGRFNCPLCGTRLVGRHNRWYWPVLVTAALFGAVVGHLTAYPYGPFAIVCGQFLGALIVGMPTDWYLESRFSILEVRAPRPPKA